MRFMVKPARWATALFVGVMAVFSPASSYGYVLPAPYILEQMVAGMRIPLEYQVIQALHVSRQLEDANLAQAYLINPVYEQVVNYRIPGMFRVDTTGHDLHLVYISAPAHSITIVDDILVSESVDWLYGYGKLFSYDRGRSLLGRLASMGIDVRVSSLGRLDKTVYYVIGAQYPDISVPQLWVDRETFRPVRLVASGAGVSPGVTGEEVLFSNWRRFNGMQYPGEMTFYENGEEVQKILVEYVDAHPGLSPSLFDIDAWVSSPLVNGDEAEEDPDIAIEIQKEIERFKRIFE